MRVDTLSMLLSLANVGPYSDALVLDKLGGLVVGSAAERIGGDISFFGFQYLPLNVKTLILPLKI
jgi:Gcd10p family